MKKALSIVLAVIMLLAVVAGCGGTETSSSASSSVASSAASSSASASFDPSKITIAVCMGSINHPVHRIVQMGFMTKAADLGYKGEISGLDEGSMQELITKWESTVTNGATGLLLWTGDDSCYEMMKEVHDGGCKIVVPHFAHSYQDTKAFLDKNISCLAASYGKAAADFICDKLKTAGVTKGTIGITQNGSNVTENAANDAFRAEIIALKVAYTCADTVFEGAEATAAAGLVTGVIQKNTDIVAGFGTTGGSPQSWATAMENTGKKGLVVIGMDYTELNIGLVKDGSITAIVCQPLFTEAQASAVALDAIFRGEDFTKSENTWFQELPAPIAYLGGTGDADVNSYQAIVDQVKEYFK